MNTWTNTGYRSPRLTWLQLSLKGISCSRRNQHQATNKASFPGATIQRHSGWLTVLDRTGIDTFSGYGFAFPCLWCRENYNLWTYRLPIHHHGSHIVLLLTKELTSCPVKCDKEPRIMESTDLTMFLTIPFWSSWLERWNGLLRNQLQHK